MDGLRFPNEIIHLHGLDIIKWRKLSQFSLELIQGGEKISLQRKPNDTSSTSTCKIYI